MSARILSFASETAMPARGHRTYIGAASTRLSGSSAAPLGHRAFSGTPRDVAICNDSVAEAARREKLRQALYEGCERAPEWTPAHRDLWSAN